MPSAGSNNSSSAIETITDVDGGGKRGQNSGGLVTFHSAPFPLGRGCSLRTARSGQGRAGVARRSEPFTARTVLRSSTRGKGVALNGPLKWPSRSPPLTHGHGLHGSLHVQGAWGCGHGLVARRGAKFPALRLYALTELLIGLSALAVPYEFAIGREIAR